MSFFSDFLKNLITALGKSKPVPEQIEPLKPVVKEPISEPAKVPPTEPVKPEIAEKQPVEPPKTVKEVKTYDEKETFKEALKLILRFEGGYVFDKDDTGGETNKGVTHTVYDEYRKSKGQEPRSVKDITEEEIADIYRTRYWVLGKCDKLPPCLAIVHFDTCVNAGVGQASKILQRTIGVKDDGNIGSVTLSKIEELKGMDKSLSLQYCGKRRDFYKELVEKKVTLQKFLKGWLNRVDTLIKYINDKAS